MTSMSMERELQLNAVRHGLIRAGYSLETKFSGTTVNERWMHDSDPTYCVSLLAGVQSWSLLGALPPTADDQWREDLLDAVEATLSSFFGWKLTSKHPAGRPGKRTFQRIFETRPGVGGVASLAVRTASWKLMVLWDKV